MRELYRKLLHEETQHYLCGETVKIREQPDLVKRSLRPSDGREHTHFQRHEDLILRGKDLIL